MAHISQKKAAKYLKEQTGLSWEWARTQVRSLPKVTDGKREKVRQEDLDRVAMEANTVPIVRSTMRPISEKVSTRIQRHGVLTRRLQAAR